MKQIEIQKNVMCEVRNAEALEYLKEIKEMLTEVEDDKERSE